MSKKSEQRKQAKQKEKEKRSGFFWSAILVGIIAAGISGGPKAAHVAPKIYNAIMGSSGPLDTPSGWAKAFLTAAHLPSTVCNYNAVRAWEAGEGGGFGNQASYNPLNVNPPKGTPWPGEHVIGAWAFPDAETGLKYTVQTLYNGYYNAVIYTFKQGNSAQADCNAIMSSPWASSHYYGKLTATC